MTNHRNSFEWLDEVLKRWQLWVAVCGAIAWITTMQIQLAYSNTELRNLKNDVNSFSSIKGEWPYLKKNVESIETKLDKILNKLDRI